MIILAGLIAALMAAIYTVFTILLAGVLSVMIHSESRRVAFCQSWPTDVNRDMFLNVALLVIVTTCTIAGTRLQIGGHPCNEIWEGWNSCKGRESWRVSSRPWRLGRFLC